MVAASARSLYPVPGHLATDSRRLRRGLPRRRRGPVAGPRPGTLPGHPRRARRTAARSPLPQVHPPFHRALLTQQVYQILAGYPDCNDAQLLRDDPLFQILADVAPDPDQPLASGSTLARFQYAFTRRQADRPGGTPGPARERAPLRRASEDPQRLPARAVHPHADHAAPAEVILDIDPTDDPVHGQQALSGYHGYYRQHQYLPLLVFEGHSGFPLAAWLRPGTVPASLRGGGSGPAPSSPRLRQAWPDVRHPGAGRQRPGRAGVCTTTARTRSWSMPWAMPATRCCSGPRRQALADLELYYAFYGRREPHVQRFEDVRGLPGGQLAAATADGRQDGNHAAGQPASLRGHQSDGARATRSTGTFMCSGARCRSSRSAS